MRLTTGVLVAVYLVSAFGIYAQQRGEAPEGGGKPIPLFFRETFKAPPVATPDVVFTTEHVANPNLEMKLYGPGSKPTPGVESGLVLVNRGDGLPGSPVVSYVWSGMTLANWAITLRDKNNYVDLTRPGAKFRWRVRPRSFRELRILIKLADGTMLAADLAEPNSTFFRETEFYFTDIERWRVIDPVQMLEGRVTAWKTNVDLSKVDEIGFTDLNRGTGHNPAGSSAVDWIEVYGDPVKRAK
jgi:hypothetical protein